MLSEHGLAGMRLLLIDLARRTKISKFRTEYQKSQWFTRSNLEALQLAKIKTLVHYSMKNVPYYRNYSDKNELGSNCIVSLADIQKLPVQEKATIRRNPELFMPDSPTENYLSRKTGGSTGDPFEYLVGTNAFSNQWAGLLRGWEFSGYRFGNKMMTVGGGSVAPTGGGSLAQCIYNKLRNDVPLSASNITDSRLVEIYNRIKECQPKLVYGYPSILYQLAQYISSNNLPAIDVGCVITTSEMLFPGQRRVLEESFGAPVFDVYGCNEVNLVAAECDEHAGLHLAMETTFVEILDNNNEPVQPGEVGRIVATGLDNRSMVFIRYDTGDLGALQSEPCRCGRGLVRIIKLQGRTRDFVRTASGQLIHGVIFNQIVMKLPWVDRYQVVQRDKTNLTITVACTSSPPAEGIKTLRNQIADLCGLNVLVRINEPFEKTKGEKTRVIISHLEDASGS